MSERRAFSVSIFARNAGAVLLIHHKRLGTWLPVGGEVDAQETPLEAARRELREETGLSGRFEAQPAAVSGAPDGLLAYEEHLAGSKGRHLNFCFLAEVETRELRPNHEFSEWRWVEAPPAECPENVRQLVGRLTWPTPRMLAQRWVEAFNARDLDRLLGLYADTAVHHSPKLRERQPETGGRITGKAASRAWWQASFERLPGLSYEPIAITADGERAVLEYWRKLPTAADLRVGELFRCIDGRIVESLVYHG
jgi:ADP-ribose pyrophosphatase YjhB (NUDIX family)